MNTGISDWGKLARLDTRHRDARINHLVTNYIELNLSISIRTWKSVSMREQPAAPKREFGSRDSDPGNPAFVGNLQHSASLPDENCNGAALEHKLSAQLRRAEERINELERERDGFFDQLLAEAKAAIQDVQSKADARVKRTIREADERVTQLQADAENEIGRLQNELSRATRDIDQLKADADKRVECVKRETDARVERTIREADERITQLQANAENEIGRLHNKLSQATRDIDQLKADADKRVECVKRETDARVASMETSAKKRIDVIQRENEDKVLRLETDLTQAKNRANRAEQWVMLFHHEIEHRLMPSVTAMRAGPKSSNPAVSSGLLTVRTVSRSPVRTWFRRLWLQISATTAFGSRAADMELANAFARPPQHEPGLSNSLTVPKAGNTVTASEPST
jgi:hypothetical protein